jgi:single-stranded-DNA-specific exonuclease
MRKSWIDPVPAPVSPDLAVVLETIVPGAPPLLAEMLARRGITDAGSARRFLDPAHYTPASPFDLPDMDRAVERVEHALRSGEHILVWGDFDVDGQTATSMLVEALRDLGGEVTYCIPLRAEGHGVHVPRLDAAIDNGARLILTCDTGIAAHTAVDHARARGIDVVITDHHQLPPELPNAYACVNPQRLHPGHPLRTLPGVGVAYKLVEVLYERAGRGDRSARHLDLVALGIVADVAEVIDDTRYLLQRGLDALRRTERIGLKKMIELAGLQPGAINEGHIGFALGPRLNALGRLDDAGKAIDLLTTDNLETANLLATLLESLNTDRKLLTEQVYKAAENQIERDPSLLALSALVLAHQGWPGGIVGIAANRLVEKYNRPVVLFNILEDGTARGSARSISGCDITAAIAAHADQLIAFGGHTMAAGLSIAADRIPEFRRALSRTVKAQIGEIELTPALHIDGYLPLAEITPDLLDALERLAPFGPGNPAPVLAARTLTLVSQRTIGRGAEHLRLTVEDQAGDVQHVLWWQAEADQLPPGRLDLAFSVRNNDYLGRREVQLVYIDSRPVDEEPIAFAHRESIIIDDRRDHASQREVDLRGLIDTLDRDGLMLWGEGLAIDGVLPRHDLRPARALAIITAPPGPAELRAALERVNPASVVLVGFDPALDSMQGFLSRLAGLVKHVIGAKNGSASVIELAALTGQREATIRAGLEWMTARGHITIEEGALKDRLALREGHRKSGGDLTATTTRLAELLRETAAYRAHFRKAEKSTLVRL